jgi:hypothetical protein
MAYASHSTANGSQRPVHSHPHDGHAATEISLLVCSSMDADCFRTNEESRHPAETTTEMVADR